MLITDQVNTAPCTDRFQARRLTFEASYFTPRTLVHPLPTDFDTSNSCRLYLY